MFRPRLASALLRPGLLFSAVALASPGAAVVSTNVPAGAAPGDVTPGGSRPIPVAPKGAPLSRGIREHIAASKAGRERVEWFPSTPPVLAPYLGNLDEYGNSALQSGAVFPDDPLSQAAQAAKSRLSDAGFRYSLWQSVSMLSMNGSASGSGALQYYTVTGEGKWAVYEQPPGGVAGWLSTEFNVQLGLSPSSRQHSPGAAAGSIASPNAMVSGADGAWISEVAWQEAFMDGRLVLIAGLVDQSNYLDANTYGNNSQGQLMNSAFVNSLILPFSYNNLGWNLQYQPGDSCYFLFGAGANNQGPGESPFQDLGFDNWSYLLEFGLTPHDVLGLGAGTYRLQPFLATVDGATQAGIALNIGQQLGANSPFAWFGRFGVGGTDVTLNGARAGIATGLVLQGPLKYAGLVPALGNDYLGAGFLWSQPSAVMEPVVHENEYGFEATYVLQLTPTASLQPDVQVLWNPVNNSRSDRSVVFQLQLNLTW